MNLLKQLFGKKDTIETDSREWKHKAISRVTFVFGAIVRSNSEQFIYQHAISQKVENQDEALGIALKSVAEKFQNHTISSWTILRIEFEDTTQIDNEKTNPPL